MFATMIRFAVPPDANWEALRHALVRSAFHASRHAPGLRAGAFTYSPERREAGGYTVWETQDDAEAFLRSGALRAAEAPFEEPSAVERCEVCAYVEDGDLVFPPDYDVQRALTPDDAPPLGF